MKIPQYLPLKVILRENPRQARSECRALAPESLNPHQPALLFPTLGVSLLPSPGRWLSWRQGLQRGAGSREGRSLQGGRWRPCVRAKASHAGPFLTRRRDWSGGFTFEGKWKDERTFCIVHVVLAALW